MSLATNLQIGAQIHREPVRPSRWCNSYTKRAFDLGCSCVGLVLCGPLILVLALIVKASSPGTVLFRHTRLSRDGKPFQVLKFRTMVQHSSIGPQITRLGDGRVTGIGRLLRRWKLDELPQLINVVSGDMSLVGPRPDVPKYMTSLAPALQAVLQLRPGITGMASLRFRNEEELLAATNADQLEDYYVRVLLPEKAKIDLDYAQHATFLSDIKCLLQTLVALTR